MSAHTPGPWEVAFREGMAAAHYGHCIHTRMYDKPGVTSGRGGIAEVKSGNGDAETRANARLIAAAPDLLAALNALLHATMYKDHPAESDAAIAAIAKATCAV